MIESYQEVAPIDFVLDLNDRGRILDFPDDRDVGLLEWMLTTISLLRPQKVRLPSLPLTDLRAL
jgi:hypothetical protein